MKQKILVVEDDVFMSSIIAEGLKKSGYDVFTALDGALGIIETQNNKPDLILLDILMPNMDGFQVMEALKKDPTTSAIPIIVLSNFGQPADIKRAKDLGVADFLVKVNFTPKEIIQKIRLVLRPTP